jgi:choline dehydrogenase
VLPYFKRSEANWRGETDYHGGSGLLTVSRHRSDSIILPRLMRAAEVFGWKATEDFHAASTEGIGLPDFTIDRRGRRASTAAAFLRAAEPRPNLVVETSAVATRLLIENNRIVGLEYAKAGALYRVRSGREVVLSGGTYNSPHLLMLSGIGPADELREAGVAPVHDLPGVGRNLQEHAIAGLAWDASGPVAFESRLRFDRMALSVLEWALFGTGIASRLPVTAMAFYKTRPELDRPDIKGNFYPTIMDSHLWFPLLRQGRGHVLSMFNLLLRPQSRGWVRLKSADPAVHPRIRLNLLAESRDIEVLRDATKMMRELFAIAPLRELVRNEVMPGNQVRTNEEIDDWIRSTAVIAQHPIGTCKMGVGGDAVVDAKLRLRGMEGLRVADAAIMPVIVGANTNAPVIMIAEKASDMILGNPPLPRVTHHVVEHALRGPGAVARTRHE